VRTGLAGPAEAPCFRIRLDAPRANALEPVLLADLHVALDAAEASGTGRVLLCGGRNFSSGGDVARFHAAAAEGRAEAYADSVVGQLQDALYRLLAMPAIVAVAARGAVTGGAAGFLFAADIAVLSPEAFVQPCYDMVGFAPDGGWTALLPDRIGAGAAAELLLRNRRLSAAEARAMGLAAEVDVAPEDRAAATLSALDPGAALAAKALIWDAERRALARRRLAAEAAAFRARIGRPEVREKMAHFLKRKEAAGNV
jgi:2-(1,2-epoxy-1,2-dihydrophenyl)acetyl-CoA isomerase